jgi:hypothetical protein
MPRQNTFLFPFVRLIRNYKIRDMVSVLLVTRVYHHKARGQRFVKGAGQKKVVFGILGAAFVKKILLEGIMQESAAIVPRKMNVLNAKKNFTAMMHPVVTIEK